MKFRCKVAYRDDPNDANGWWEEYEYDDVDDPRQWAEDTIAKFNATLRPHEQPRRLIVVEVIDDKSVKDHRWTKQNLGTKHDPRYGCYDEVRCASCGVVARRYGVDRYVRQDPYRARVYKRCDTATAHLEKKGVRDV